MNVSALPLAHSNSIDNTTFCAYLSPFLLCNATTSTSIDSPGALICAPPSDRFQKPRTNFPLLPIKNPWIGSQATHHKWCKASTQSSQIYKTNGDKTGCFMMQKQNFPPNNLFDESDSEMYESDSLEFTDQDDDNENDPRGTGKKQLYSAPKYSSKQPPGSPPIPNAYMGGHKREKSNQERLNLVRALSRRARTRGVLRLFLDTADVNAYHKWLPTGMFYGVTTNPTLLQKAGVACTLEQLQNLVQIVIQDYGLSEIHIQAWGGTYERYVATGMKIAALNNKVVVKLPMTHEGALAAAILIRRGLKVNMTSIMRPQQVVVAASIGASYVAPYLGRMGDLIFEKALKSDPLIQPQAEQIKDQLMEEAETEALNSVLEMQELLKGFRSRTHIMVASIRDSSKILQLILDGKIDIFTISPELVNSMLNVPETIQFAEDFEKASLSSASFAPLLNAALKMKGQPGDNPSTNDMDALSDVSDQESEFQNRAFRARYNKIQNRDADAVDDDLPDIRF